MNQNNDITLKIVGLPKFNELDYLQYKYDEALERYLESKLWEDRIAFEAANKALFEAKYAYQKGFMLLAQRVLSLLF